MRHRPLRTDFADRIRQGGAVLGVVGGLFVVLFAVGRRAAPRGRSVGEAHRDLVAFGAHATVRAAARGCAGLYRVAPAWFVKCWQ